MARFRSAYCVRGLSVRALFQVARLVSPRHKISGFEVVNFLHGSSVSDEEYVRLTEAIHLIARYSSRYMRWLQSGIRYFAIERSGVWASYHAFSRVCGLDPVVLRWKPESIAVLIVHEATHARLWDMGFVSNRRNRDRIEHICVSAEIDFAKKLPNGDALVQWANKRLWVGGDTETQTNVRRITRMKWSGVPDWMIRVVKWLGH